MSLLGLEFGVAAAGGATAILAAIQQWSTLDGKPRKYVVLFLAALLIQIGTQGLQYYLSASYKENAQKRSDAETATAIYTFLDKDAQLLAESSNNYYITGYRYFRRKQPGDWEKASSLFVKSIDIERYIASSYYLLAYMDTHNADHEMNYKGNWSVAEKYLERAIKSDPTYASAYYLRAKIAISGRKIDDALGYLRIVIDSNKGAVQCDDIVNDKIEIELYWKELLADTRFANLQMECRKKYSIDRKVTPAGILNGPKQKQEGKKVTRGSVGNVISKADLRA